MSKKLKSLKNHSRKHRPLRIKQKRAVTTTQRAKLKKYDDGMTVGKLVCVGDWK